jgi:hypothetical protein
MPFDEHEERYDVLAEILDIVQNALVELLTSKNLRRPSIERWRWDQPVVTLSWVAPDYIDRNINAMVLHDTTNPSVLHIEANAWKDDSVGIPYRSVRLWKHLDAGDVPVSLHSKPITLDSRRLRELINVAYNTVVELGIHDLEERELINALPTGGPW